MEGRARKHNGGQGSPERTTRNWPEGPPSPLTQHLKQSPSAAAAATAAVRRIPVVYYLCRNRHLEHPHFIEVPLSSPDGLYLRDVINRLNVLRGKGMASMYSWSCKRSYKNGFVWHDLSGDDLVLPAQANEYVLKGSELLDQSPSDRILQSNDNPKLQNLKHSQQQNHPNLRNQEASCSSSSSLPYATARKELKPPPSPPTPREDERSPLLRRPGSSGSTSSELQTSSKPSSCDAESPNMVEYCVYNPTCAADASTQTEDSRGRTGHKVHDSYTQGISTDDCPTSAELQCLQNSTPRSKADSDIGQEEISQISRPLTSSSASSSSAKTETLESLIRADARKMNTFKIVEEEEVLNLGPRLRASNLLMQLITCGSISVKDHHNFGLIPTYKAKFSHIKFPSPKLSSSVLLGELDCLSENPRLMGMKFEEKEYFSGSLIETKKHNVVAEIMPTLKRSSSYNSDRSCKPPDSRNTPENTVDSSRSKCLPRTIKITSNRHSRNEIAKSPLSDGSRSSSAGQDQLFNDGNIKTMGSATNGLSTRIESFRKEKEKIIKIEERLISGARVIIQSIATGTESEEGSDT